MTEVAVKSLLLESARYDPTDRIVSKAEVAIGSNKNTAKIPLAKWANG